MAEFTFHLLGPPLLERGDQPVTQLRKKAMALLAYLSIEGGAQSRDALATLLWPEHGQARARANLRRCLFSLNKSCSANLLASRQDTLRLADTELSTDVNRFRRLSGGCRGHQPHVVCNDCIPFLEEAASVYRNDFLFGFSLPDCNEFDQWQRVQTETLRIELTALLDWLIHAYTERQRYPEALIHAERLLSLDPLEESSQRLVMCLHALCGRRAAALKQFQRCRRLLREELGDEPEEATEELYNDIKNGRLKPKPGQRALPEPKLLESERPTINENFQPDSRFCLTATLPKPSQQPAVIKLFEKAGGRVLNDWNCPTPALCIEFSSTSAALDAAFAARDLSIGPIRMAIHAVEVDGREEGRAFPEHTAALLACIPSGETILTTSAARDRLRVPLPAGVSLRPLGYHRLSDLSSHETLYQALHPRYPREIPTLHTLDTVRNNLPSQPERFVGRRSELPGVISALANPGSRIVTLTGPAGTGKTRLALHAAAAAVDLFDDGVFLVDLSAIRNPREVGRLIAATLELREAAGSSRPVDSVLADYLRSRRLLLVLDNFEHLMSAVRLVLMLSGAAHGLKVLVTSRQRLGVKGEREIEVPPLQLPEYNAEPDHAIQSESAELFLCRAALTGRELQRDRRTVEAVVEVCRRLDGLPLAIELAAARLKILSPTDLLRLLPHRLNVLKAQPNERPERQKTLERAIDWSYDLLREPERTLFVRMAVFTGGWTLEAAERVCTIMEEKGIQAGILDGISSLVEKNLVRRVEAPGESRFYMLETIREYASHRFEADPLAEHVRERHARFYLQFARHATHHLHGPDQMQWLDRLEHDYENLQAALKRFLDKGEILDATRMCISLEWFWYRYAHFGDAGRWLLAVVDGAHNKNSDSTWRRLRGRALRALGWHLLVQGDWPSSRRRYFEALDAATAVGDRANESLSLSGLGTVERWLGENEQGKKHGLEALKLARVLRDPLLIELALIWSYATTGGRFEGEPPIQELQEARLLSLRLGDLWAEAHIRNGLADVYTELGDYNAARENYNAALERFRELKDGWLSAWNLEGLARLAVLTGDFGSACDATVDAIKIFNELGDRANAVFMLGWLGTAFHDAGDLENAATLFGAFHVLEANQPGRADFAPVAARVEEASASSRESAPARWQKGCEMSYEQVFSFVLSVCATRVTARAGSPPHRAAQYR